MDKYTRHLFGNKCPYTDDDCNNDIDCSKCKVEAEERVYLTDDDIIELAKQDRPISREELGNISFYSRWIQPSPLLLIKEQIDDK